MYFYFSFSLTNSFRRSKTCEIIPLALGLPLFQYSFLLKKEKRQKHDMTNLNCKPCLVTMPSRLHHAHFPFTIRQTPKSENQNDRKFSIIFPKTKSTFKSISNQRPGPSSSYIILQLPGKRMRLNENHRKDKSPTRLYTTFPWVSPLEIESLMHAYPHLT